MKIVTFTHPKRIPNSISTLRSWMTRAIIATALLQALAPHFSQASEECQILFDSAHPAAVGQLGDLVETSELRETKIKVEPLAGNLIPDAVQLHAYRFERKVLPSDRKDPGYKESLIDILKMLTETIYESGSPKTTIEKGELKLARSIGHGQSVEFEYIGDKRGIGSAFRLNKIVLYKPNGQSITLEKTPVSDDGLRMTPHVSVLAEKSDESNGTKVMASLQLLENADLAQWSARNTSIEGLLKDKKKQDVHAVLKDVSGSLNADDQAKIKEMQDSLATIQAPVVIEGPMLADVLTWIDRIPSLPIGTMRAALSKNQITRLIWTARVRSNVKIATSVSRKQIFKYVLIGSLFIGVEHLPTAYSHYAEAFPMHGITHLFQQDAIPNDQSKIVKQLMDKLGDLTTLDADLQKELHDRANLPGHLETEQTDAIDLTRFESVIHDLTARETAANGNVAFYLTDLSQHVLTSVTPNDVAAAREKTDSGYLIASFDKQQLLLLVPISQKASSTLPGISIVSISRAEHQQVYDVLKASLTEQMNGHAPAAAAKAK